MFPTFSAILVAPLLLAVLAPRAEAYCAGISTVSRLGQSKTRVFQAVAERARGSASDKRAHHPHVERLGNAPQQGRHLRRLRDLGVARCSYRAQLRWPTWPRLPLALTPEYRGAAV